MTITIVGSAITGNGATIAKASVTAGSLLTLQTAYYRTATTGLAEPVPTDSQGTWSIGSSGVPGLPSGGTDAGASIFYQANVASGTHTVTPQAASGKNLTLIEWDNATTTPLDVAANAKTDSFTGTSQVTGTTATTAQANELVLIALGLGCPVGVSDVGFTNPVSGFTTSQIISNDFSDMGTFHAYKNVTNTGTQSATFNWTDTEAGQGSGAAIATFKDVTAGGAAPRIITPITSVSMGR